MDKNIIGLLFILAGVIYGSFTLDSFYNITLGVLVKYQLINLPPAQALNRNLLGRKPIILIYSLILIAIGVFILIKL